MRLTKQSRIAIDILVACARRTERLLRTEEAAALSGATKDHAAQVVHVLTRAGLILTHRGRTGGLTLGLPAASIEVGRVLRLLQPELFDETWWCPPEAERTIVKAGAERPSRPVDLILSSAATRLGAILDGLTIADLAGDAEVATIHSEEMRQACRSCPLLSSLSA